MGCGSSTTASNTFIRQSVIIHQTRAGHQEEQYALSWSLNGAQLTEDEESEEENDEIRGMSFEEKLAILQGREKRTAQGNKGWRNRLGKGRSGEQDSVVPGSQNWNTQQLILGNPNISSIKSDHKVIRVFTSSTFTDTKHERNTLMERVYPKLDAFCKSLGFDFQVVDMRWGVREDAVDDHMTTELCLKELHACQKVSTGPYFVTFLSHKYGYRPFPRCIQEKDYDLITKDVYGKQRELLNKWFKKDENAIPVVYVLQKISSVFPHLREDEEKTKTSWWEDFNQLQDILQEGVKKNSTDENLNKLFRVSVTEREIEKGLLNNKINKPLRHCAWFKRNITDIKDQPASKPVSKYYECVVKDTDPEQKVADAHDLLDDLHSRIEKKLGGKNVYEYNVKWHEGEGISLSNPQHEQYMSKLCEDFEQCMRSMIEQGIIQRLRSQIDDPLYRECAQHLNLCHVKCKSFTGRDEVLGRVQSYVLGDSNHPLVLHGGSGYGKTSIMAMAARHAWFWTQKGQGVVMFRFIGTTQASSSLRPLLKTLNEQMMAAYNVDTDNSRSDLKWLVEDFRFLMSKATKKKPLVILLDSLDQLDSLDGGRHLHWLPRQLPHHVKLVLSTLPEEGYGCFPRLKALYENPASYIEVPSLSKGEVSSILDRWLEAAGRTLTPQQRANVTAAFNKCPYPLVLKINFDEARRWASYEDPDDTVLNASIYHVIKNLFERIERQHGQQMVQHALGCLTASDVGLSEGEIEDLLSLNDRVLNDVYQYWQPPQRRLPPLLWVRVKNDLEEYMVHRGVDGTQVIYWYHRQFIETARRLYLSEHQQEWVCHQAIAEFFSGRWSDKPKPYTDTEGKAHEALRYVDKQPLCFDKAKGNYNVRKLMRLPYHLIKSDDLAALKRDCLCNYEFLLAKLKACGYRNLREDFKLARYHYPDDRDLHVVMETLQLSQDAISGKNDASDLAGQLIGRIRSTSSAQALVNQAQIMLDEGTLPAEAVQTLSLLESFLQTQKQYNKVILDLLSQARHTDKPNLLPHTNFLTCPGGRLMHKLAGHVDVITDIDIAAEGDVVVTGSVDKTVKLWDIKTGEMTQAVDFDADVGQVKFCCNDEKVAVSCGKKQLCVIDVDKGIVGLRLKVPSGPDNSQICMPVAVAYTGDEEDRLLSMRNKKVDVWDTANGRLVSSVDVDLDDWSTRNEGQTVEQRHLVTMFDCVIYAGYRSHQYSYFSVDTLSTRTNTVFNPYAWNRKAMEPDYAPKSVDHISAIALVDSGDDEQCHVILCNGRTQEVHFFALKSQNELKKVQGAKYTYIENFYPLPEDGRLFFFTSRHHVGMYNIEAGSYELLLEHPCKVKKVVTYDGRMIGTIAVDNKIRIWDKKKAPLTQDLSDFTEKVTVGDKTDKDKLASEFSSMFAGITGSTVSENMTKSLLTSEHTQNYWSPDITEQPQESGEAQAVVSTFHRFLNTRYLAVTHDVVVKNSSSAERYCTICVTVWDVAGMQCVCRCRIPASSAVLVLHVHDAVMVYVEGQQVLTAALPQWTVGKVMAAEPPHLYHKPAKKVASLLYNCATQLILESPDGRSLHVYDVTSGEMTSQFTPSAKHHNNTGHFTSLQMSTNEQTLVAVYGDTELCVWDVKSAHIQHCVNLTEMYRHVTPGDKQSRCALVVDVSSDGKYVTAAIGCASREQPKAEHIAHVLNVTSGNITKISGSEDKGKADKSCQPIKALVSFTDTKSLMMLGASDYANACVLDESSAGTHSNRIVVTDDQLYCVTWCDQPQDKTIRYWTYMDNQWKQLGSYTPDKEVSSVCLIDNGLSVVIDSDVGLIRLRLEGKGLDTSPLPSSQQPLIYKYIDVNQPFPSKNNNAAEHDGVQPTTTGEEGGAPMPGLGVRAYTMVRPTTAAVRPPSSTGEEDRPASGTSNQL